MANLVLDLCCIKDTVDNPTLAMLCVVCMLIPPILPAIRTPKLHDLYAEAQKHWRKVGYAQGAVSTAKRSGKLKKPASCELCGDDTVFLVAHHEDYSKPLEVNWLCYFCHSQLHALHDRHEEHYGLPRSRPRIR